MKHSRCEISQLMRPKSHNLCDWSEISHYAGSLGSKKTILHDSRFVVKAHSFCGRIDRNLVANIVSLHTSIAAAERYRLEAEWYQRTMRESRKGNGGMVVQPKAEPFYRRFEKRRQTEQTDNHAGK